MFTPNYPLAQPVMKRRKEGGLALPQQAFPKSGTIKVPEAVTVNDKGEAPGKDVQSYLAGESMRQKIAEASSPQMVNALLEKAKKAGTMSRKTWGRVLNASAVRLTYFEDKRRKELANPAKVQTAKQEAEAERAAVVAKNEEIIAANEAPAKVEEKPMTKRKVAKAKKAVAKKSN